MSAHKFVCMYKGHPNETTQTTPLIVLSLNGWVWFSWWKGICELFSRCCHKCFVNNIMKQVILWRKNLQAETAFEIPTEILAACGHARGSHIYMHFCLDSARSSRLHAANLKQYFLQLFDRKSLSYSPPWVCFCYLASETNRNWIVTSYTEVCEGVWEWFCQHLVSFFESDRTSLNIRYLCVWLTLK